MKFQCFEEIVAWQKAQDVVVAVYEVFSELRDFNFKEQILSAVLSISNNIAEGFERNSSDDFSKFSGYSPGSCSEVKSMVYLALRLKYITEVQQKDLLIQTTEVAKIINGLIRFLKK